jgi:hypothetical protein
MRFGKVVPTIQVGYCTLLQLKSLVRACVSGCGSPLELAAGVEVEVLDHRRGLMQQSCAGAYEISSRETKQDHAASTLLMAYLKWRRSTARFNATKQCRSF